jgi:putative endonuclease
MLPTVYIMASQRNGTLYIGVTSDLLQRVQQHKQGICDGFTHDNDFARLVYYESFEVIN